MPHIETVDDLAESLANMMGIYGITCDVEDCGCRDVCKIWPCECLSRLGDHSDSCMCRMCFTSEMRRRIRESVENEVKLKL